MGHFLDHIWYIHGKICANMIFLLYFQKLRGQHVDSAAAREAGRPHEGHRDARGGRQPQPEGRRRLAGRHGGRGGPAAGVRVPGGHAHG